MAARTLARALLRPPQAALARRLPSTDKGFTNGGDPVSRIMQIRKLNDSINRSFVENELASGDKMGGTGGSTGGDIMGGIRDGDMMGGNGGGGDRMGGFTGGNMMGGFAGGNMMGGNGGGGDRMGGFAGGNMMGGGGDRMGGFAGGNMMGGNSGGGDRMGGFAGGNMMGGNSGGGDGVGIGGFTFNGRVGGNGGFSPGGRMVGGFTPGGRMGGYTPGSGRPGQFRTEMLPPTGPRVKRDVLHITQKGKKTFVTVTDVKGNRKAGASAGCLEDRKGRSRLARYAGEATGEHMGRSARKMGIKSLVVRVKGYSFFRKKKKIVLGFADGFRGERVRTATPIMYIHDVTQLAHNGCRLPKKTRK